MPTQLQMELRDRQANRAAALRTKADAAHQDARAQLAGIPPGQPVLVGHHSEARHRRDLAKFDRRMRKSIDLDRKAQDAAATRSGRAVLGRDPEAIEELGRKLERLTASRERMKLINKTYRRGGWEAVLEVDGMTLEKIARLKVDMLNLAEKAPYPPYALKNIGATIRKTEKRIESIRDRLTAGDRTLEFEGGTYEEDAAEDRIRLTFDSRLSPEHYRLMRSNGWRWSRDNGAFQRHLNNRSRYSATTVVKTILGVDLEL